MKNILLLLLLTINILLAATLTPKNSYPVNQNITIDFKNFTNHHKDWIAIYPAGSSNAWGNVKQWRWTDNKTNGTLNFNALPAGNYEVRGFYNNSYHSEATAPFKVTAQGGGNPTLTPKNSYPVNQNITIDFKNFTNHHKDWIAIYPAGSSNAWGNVKQWHWTDNKTNGTLNFNALPAGNYEVRGFYNNSFHSETTAPFRVNNQEDNTPRFTAKKEFKFNETIKINFSNFTNHHKDWIAIYSAGSSNAWGNVKQWHWTDNKTNGTLNFNALPAGNYEVRGFYNNSFTPKTSYSFKVTGHADNIPLTKVHNLIKRGHSHYIVVGDSTRASFDAPLIAKNIRNAFAKYNLEVSLNAQGGYRVEQFINPALSQYPHYKKVINLIQGNGSTTIVDMSLGVNDIGSSNGHHSSTKELERLIKKAIALIKGAKPQTTFVFTSPNAFLNNQIYTNRTMTAYRNLSQELGIPFINFHDNVYVNYTRAQQQALYRDGIHYSKHGTEVQADYIINQLRP